MSENSKCPEICSTIIIPDRDKEKISISENNDYRSFKFKEKEFMVIPLEGVKLNSRPKSQRKETTQTRKTKVNNKEETGRDEKNQ